MIQLLATLALFLTLPAPAHALPDAGHPSAPDDAGQLSAPDHATLPTFTAARHSPRHLDVNLYGSALPARFTLIAPPALLPAPAPATPVTWTARRWLLSLRLLL